MKYDIEKLLEKYQNLLQDYQVSYSSNLKRGKHDKSDVDREGRTVCAKIVTDLELLLKNG